MSNEDTTVIAESELSMNYDEIVSGIEAICAPLPSCRKLRDSILVSLAALVEQSKTIYVVKYSNYEPAEVDSAWSTKELADKRCNEANEQSRRMVRGSDNWKVVKWTLDD